MSRVRRLPWRSSTSPTETPEPRGRSAMKELVFALEFKGNAAPVPGSDKKLQAKTSATSQTLRSVLKADGVQATVESAAAGSAGFESEVEIGGEGASVDCGRVRDGD